MGWGEEFSEHHQTTADRMRKRHVAVGALLAALHIVGAMGGAARAGFGAVARPVLFGEHDVEADRGGVRFRQLVDKIRHGLARPRPTAEKMNRLVVDVDDPDGLFEIVRPRIPALILVKDQILQVNAERREQGRKCQRQSVGAEDDEKIRSPLA